MDSATFEVRAKTRDEFRYSGTLGGVIEEPYYPDDLFNIEDYPYGCEGEGHFLSTKLEPGTYKVMRVEETT